MIPYWKIHKKSEEKPLLGEILMWHDYLEKTQKEYSEIPRTQKEYCDYQLYCVRNGFQFCSWGYYWRKVFDAYWEIRDCYDNYYDFLVAHELTDYKDKVI
ncbi:MAG: hypothetical protein ACI4IS_05060 [Acutalibacteraceae bacterium]